MSAATLDICTIHRDASLIFNLRWERFICGECANERKTTRIALNEAKKLSADASRFNPRHEIELIEIDPQSTEDVLNISAYWPNGEPRGAGFCKRRTCLFVRLEFDRQLGIMLCHQCEFFELPGEIASKDMRVIYARNQELPNEKEIIRCPRCDFGLRYEESLELFTCYACYYFEVAEVQHLESTLKRVKQVATKSGRKDKTLVGAGAVAL